MAKTTKINSISPEQQVKCDEVVEQTYALLTKPVDRKVAKRVIAEMFPKENPQVFFTQSPMEAKVLDWFLLKHYQNTQFSESDTTEKGKAKLVAQACKDIDKNIQKDMVNVVEKALTMKPEDLLAEIDTKTREDKMFYCSIYWVPWLGLYEQAKIVGVQFEEDLFNRFKDLAQNIHFCIPRSGWVIIAEKPVEIHWNDTRTFLHNDAGPAIRWADDFSIWSIDGLRVDEQIVMRPQTQTIDQINSESNNDIKAIRINRFGIPRYLEETGATVLDQRTNDIEGTHEALLKSADNNVYLWPTCPSGKLCPPLLVESSITTCAEAQEWLAGNKPFNVVART